MPDPDRGVSGSDAVTVDSESEDATTLEEAAVVTDAPVTAVVAHWQSDGPARGTVPVTFTLIVDSEKVDSEGGPSADCETSGAAPNEHGLVEPSTAS